MASLGDRMKENYENRSKTFLTRRTPVIVRLDGKAFHTYTKHLIKPYSEVLHTAMTKAAIALCENVSGARLAYTQSDEISLLIVDYNRFDTSAWYDYNVQKIVSVTASIATAVFNREMFAAIDAPPAYFDSRAFNIPEEEVNNYFIWRQKDWERNSVAMLAQSLFSPKQLHKCNRDMMMAMCKEQYNQDWNALEAKWKLGTTLRHDAEKGWHEVYQEFTDAPFVTLDALEREER